MPSRPRLRIVTGKGGVGKTTIACALAVAEVLEGRRVLLAEVNGRDRVSSTLGYPRVGSKVTELLENLWAVDMNPADTIHEYALLVLKFEVLYRAVFENRLVKPFLRLVPSLGELVMLGKVWYHEEEELGGRPRFDVLIVDAPATGHARSLLSTPQAVEGTVPAGPLRDNARVIRELFTDPARTRLHIVATPEEMPVNEAIELDEARSALGIPLGATFVNQRVAALPASGLRSLATPDLLAVASALRRREQKRQAGDAQLDRLPPSLRHNLIDVPRLASDATARSRVETIAHLLIPALRDGRLR